jgi:hypothetical protein
MGSRDREGETTAVGLAGCRSAECCEGKKGPAGAGSTVGKLAGRRVPSVLPGSATASGPPTAAAREV